MRCAMHSKLSDELAQQQKTHFHRSKKEKAKYVVTGLDFSPKLFFIREEQEELHKEGSNPNSAAVKDSCK